MTKTEIFIALACIYFASHLLAWKVDPSRERYHTPAKIVSPVGSMPTRFISIHTKGEN